MTAIALGPDCTCDLTQLIETRLLVQCNSGGGKSWTIRRLLEQTHGHVQQLVIDPEGELATLRERFDYVVAARQGGDTAAEPRAAALLAERLLELGVSAIVDIYELKPPERVRFVKLFCEALVNAPKRLWHPVLVVLDEAHMFCPETGRKRGETESTGAVIDLATRGRKRGFCAVLATQRLSKLHKDAAAECNNKLIGRTGLDVDMRRAADELGFGTKDDRLQLRDLEPGEFFAFGPALSRTVQRIRIGPVRTTHPKAGARIAFTPPPPTTKVKALLPQLADLPAEVETRTRTIAELEAQLKVRDRRIRELERAAPAPTVERVEVPILKDTQVRSLEQLVQRFEASGVHLSNLAEAVRERGTELTAASRAATANGGPTAPAVRAARPTAFPRGGQRGAAATPPPRARTLRPPSDGTADPSLGKRERAALTVLAQFPDGCRAGKLALLAGYRYGGGFRTGLSTIRSKGYIEGENTGLMHITEAGLDALGSYEPLPAGPDLVEYWLTHRSLGKRERCALRALLEHPDGLTGEELAAAAGYEWGGGFRTGLSTLRTAGLLVGKNTERMRAIDELLEASA